MMLHEQFILVRAVQGEICLIKWVSYSESLNVAVGAAMSGLSIFVSDFSHYEVYVLTDMSQDELESDEAIYTALSVFVSLHEENNK